MKRNRPLTVSVAILVLAFTVTLARGAALNCPSCEVDDAHEAKYNRALNLTITAQKKAEATHLAYGFPVPSASALNEHMLHQKEFLVWYDDDLRVPLWVSYKLTRKQIAMHRPRTECFRVDPRLVPAARALCDDYDEPTFDQGHLAPNADFTRTEEMMVNTYLYSNMTPQFANFNRHTWERLEELVRAWCDKYGDLYVISGSVFDKDNNGLRDNDTDAQRLKQHVAIPTHFYKIIFKKKFIGPSDSIAILLPHENGKHTGANWAPWMVSHITTIAEIRKLTGIDFLSNVSAPKRAEVENFKANTLWPME
jgi:endonuclease G, mitochondrial